MWLIIQNGEEGDRKMINLDNVAFIEPEGMGGCFIQFPDGTDLTVSTSFDQISKIIGDHIRSEIIEIT